MPWQPTPNVVHWYDVDRGAEGGGHHNWYGITDVVDLIERAPGPSGSFTEAWLGSTNDLEEVAKRVSPLTYVRQGLPPVLTVHGDADPIVPYSHGVRLHQALDEAGVPNENSSPCQAVAMVGSSTQKAQGSTPPFVTSSVRMTT